jgi:hypothetical protein
VSPGFQASTVVLNEGGSACPVEPFELEGVCHRSLLLWDRTTTEPSAVVTAAKQRDPVLRACCTQGL